MSNLDDFNAAAGSSEKSYGCIAHYCNTTVEDCMCARAEWKQELLSRWRYVYPSVRRVEGDDGEATP